MSFSDCQKFLWNHTWIKTLYKDIFASFAFSINGKYKLPSKVILNIWLQSFLKVFFSNIESRLLLWIGSNFDFPLPCVTKIEFGNSDARLLDEVEGTVISKIEKL